MPNMRRARRDGQFVMVDSDAEIERVAAIVTDHRMLDDLNDDELLAVQSRFAAKVFRMGQIRGQQGHHGHGGGE